MLDLKKPWHMMIIDVEFFLRTKKEELRQAYLMDNKDKGQREAAEDWEDTLEDKP